MRRVAIILLCLISIGLITIGAERRRSSKDVRRERQQTEEQIIQTRTRISKNEQETSRQLNKLNALKANIALRADTIRTLNKKIAIINKSIKVLSDSIEFLELYAEKLRRSHGSTLRTMRTRRQCADDLAFVFSAETFSQVWRRISYLRQVADASARRTVHIKDATSRLSASREKLTLIKDTLQISLTQVQHTQNALNDERADANILVKSLRRKGKELNRELQRRCDQAEALDRELEKAIEREIAEAAERERKRQEEERKRQEEERRRREADAAKSQLADTFATRQLEPHAAQPVAAPIVPEHNYADEAEAARELTGSFQTNKGRLLFPVAGRYTITSHFGTNEHPELSKIKFDNLGIDIEVPAGTHARAIFDGVVSTIFRLEGFHNVVIIRHGEYLSVYAGIETLAVKKGDKVKVGQDVGAIFSDGDDDNRTSLHFEIRHEKVKLNPVEWVK